MPEKAMAHTTGCDLPAARVREVKGTPHASRAVCQKGGASSLGGADGHMRGGGRKTEMLEGEEARVSAVMTGTLSAADTPARRRKSRAAPGELSLSDIAFSMDFEDEILEFQGWTMELCSAGPV
jgi:hypothetical protein